jgi:hypothetical protein
MTKREPGAWGYNRATLSLGDINTGTWSSRLGGWTQGWRPCSVKSYCCKMQRPQKQMVYFRQTLQDLLRKVMAKKWCFSNIIIIIIIVNLLIIFVHTSYVLCYVVLSYHVPVTTPHLPLFTFCINIIFHSVEWLLLLLLLFLHMYTLHFSLLSSNVDLC